MTKYGVGNNFNKDSPKPNANMKKSTSIKFELCFSDPKDN